jgi:hypothetical protein
MNRMLLVAVAVLVIICTLLSILTTVALSRASEKVDHSTTTILVQMQASQEANRKLVHAVGSYLACVYREQYESDDPDPVDACGDILEEAFG